MKVAEDSPHIYSIATFSTDQKAVAGPGDLREEDALTYLTQRMADQHRGGLTPTYWREQARSVLDRARDQAGAACIHRVARGRGVIVTAELPSPAAMYEVRVLPLYADDGEAGELCAAFDHPRLAVAMREAGARAESWMRGEAIQCQKDEERRGELVGFEAEITARLASPLLPGHAESGRGDADRGESYAPRRGCPAEPVSSAR